MQPYLPILIALLVVIAAVRLTTRWLRIPPPLLLALAGGILALLPGFPRLPLHPDLILLLFLPPLLYADAFHTSWHDFRRWLRPILLLAVGLVALTILVVGVVAHAVIPGLPWPACFVLGAVVSPTDTVAVQAVIERLRVPRRVTAILGGESLVNDATGLVGVQLGVVVALSGAFEAGAVAFQFAWVAGGGIAVGVLIGGVFAALNRVVRDAQILFVLSLLAPYLAFLIAHAMGTSGVLAVVVAGFFVAWRIDRVPAAARVQLVAVWDLLTYVLNGCSFVFIGWEAPALIHQIGAESGDSLLVPGLVVTAAVILTRIAWTVPGAYVSLWLTPRQRQREGGYPPWRNVVLASWCGVRGVVSLAAALSLPQIGADGRAFPGRTEILACTLCVILGTLLVQGMTLLPLVRLLGLRDDENSGAEVNAAREAVLAAGIARLDAFCTETSCPVAVHPWRTAMADELTALRDADADQRALATTRLEVSREVHRAVAVAQSVELLRLRNRGTINDKTYLGLLLELDRQNFGT